MDFKILTRPFFYLVQVILKQLSRWVLEKRKPVIIAVTGSVAKTSTKEAIWRVLKERFDVQKSEGNLNTEIGLPLAILGFKSAPVWFLWPFVLVFALGKAFWYQLSFVHYPKMLVLEMAADKPNDIAYLVSFIRPKIGVVTAVGPAHLQAFHTLERIAQEKGRLVEALPDDGYAILNQADPLVAKMAQKTKAQVLYFIPQDGDIALAVAKKMAQLFGIRHLPPLPSLKGRLNLLAGLNNSLVIDDTYNANPLSVAYALKQLKKLAQQHLAKRRIAVLGDMLELGRGAAQWHRQIGRLARSYADLLLTTGQLAQEMAEAGGGHFFPDKKVLIDYLKKEIRPGDLVLVKASRKMKFEEIVQAIIKKESKWK
jgi:UDP-N-acetylmuramoyl-tripeptide--D-alanyl-D-alanine ligase